MSQSVSNTDRSSDNKTRLCDGHDYVRVYQNIKFERYKSWDYAPKLGQLKGELVKGIIRKRHNDVTGRIVDSYTFL